MNIVLRSVVSVMVAWLWAAGAPASEWPQWRGPNRDGVSDERNLIDGWSRDGENLIWRVPLVGRSTPVVFDGKVCANGRAGEGIYRQEMVACFDAADGEKLWERRFNVYHSSVPWTRVGWANVAADVETGYLYVQGVGGLFFCLDSDDGEIVWSRNLIEEFGFMEGYGGRTQTPLVDGDRVIVSFSNTSWGEEARPLHRYRAFDKRSGELLWTSSPASSQADKNTQSTPNLLVVDGRRLIVAGNGGGGIYAVEAATGEPVWGFQLSQRGINTSVAVDGTTVFAAHSEENIDEPNMGRVVAIDGTGSGDVTASHELWRAAHSVGFSSPTIHRGRLYVLDNSANLYALDAATGRKIWELDVGRVGKASPVVADGKLYLTEVNGRFVIVEPGDEEARILDLEEIPMEGESRMAEIYGSPAIAYGRIYFTTEEGLYCLGDKSRPFEAAPGPAPAAAAERAPEGAEPARVRVMPFEVLLKPGEAALFRLEAFDAKGRPLGSRDADWSLEGLRGQIDGGRFVPESGSLSQTGRVVARLGGLDAYARVRVVEDLPLSEDFESVEVGARPEYMSAYVGRFEVAERDGGKVLAKGPSPVKIDRHISFLGRPDYTDYTIEADVLGSREGRRVPDVGLINSGYTLELLGAHQQLEVRTWQSGLRMAQKIDFPWQTDRWYRMKLRVSQAPGSATIHGKVWPLGEPEPAEWSLTVEDPLPIVAGSAGLSAYSPSNVYWDNLKVTPNP